MKAFTTNVNTLKLNQVTLQNQYLSHVESAHNLHILRTSAKHQSSAQNVMAHTKTFNAVVIYQPNAQDAMQLIMLHGLLNALKDL